MWSQRRVEKSHDLSVANRDLSSRLIRQCQNGSERNHSLPNGYPHHDRIVIRRCRLGSGPVGRDQGLSRPKHRQQQHRKPCLLYSRRHTGHHLQRSTTDRIVPDSVSQARAKGEQWVQDDIENERDPAHPDSLILALPPSDRRRRKIKSPGSGLIDKKGRMTFGDGGSERGAAGAVVLSFVALSRLGRGFAQRLGMRRARDAMESWIVI